MPSAEKSNNEAIKVETAPSNEPKTLENAQKDGEHNNGEKGPIQQQFLQIIQNKVRNLEKRKNKLDGYIKEEEAGKELSSEQQRAVLKYEEVTSQLGISKEFCKQFQVMANAAAKDQKRLERKAAFLKQMQETTKVREVIIIQDLLRQLKNETIRNDFLNAQNGACLVEAAEMDVLELFSKHSIPVHPNFSNEPSFSNSAKTAADYLSFVVDGRNRQFLESGFTFEKIKALFHRIQTCGYFEKDIKVVEVEERPSQSESATPQSNIDLDSKDENNVMEEASGSSIIQPSAPQIQQLPNPTQLFNGANVSTGMIPIQVIPQQQVQQQQPMKTTVTAVENAFYNQMKYSQPQGPMSNNTINNNNNVINSNNTNSSNEIPMAQPNQYIEVFATANISFLQDSLVEQQGSQQVISATAPTQHQKIPPNMLNNNQPKHSPTVQQVHSQQAAPTQQQIISTQTYTNQNFQSAPQQQTTHNYPPGLKLQGNASNIPVSYSQQQSSSQQTQQAPITSIPPQQHLISKEQPEHYQNIVAPSVQQQYQQMPTNIQNLQEVEQKTLNAHQQNVVVDVPSDKPTNETSDRKVHAVDKDNNIRSIEWNPGNSQQQPQIDTWNNDTPSGGNSSQSAGSGNYPRFNRNRGSSDRAKYNNYRNSQPRGGYNSNNNNNENGNGDASRGEGGPTTFFRNNERYNSGSSGRYSNNVNERGNYSKRENYRTGGSGRFSSSMGSSNPVQRK